MTREQRLLEAFELDLRADADGCVILDGLLHQLHGQLMARDSLAINDLNARIEALIAQLGQRAERRAKVLAAFGLAHDAEGVECLLQRFSSERATPLRALWQRMGAQVQDCRRLNERNGTLMAMQHDILNQLLAEPGQQLYQPQVY